MLSEGSIDVGSHLKWSPDGLAAFKAHQTLAILPLRNPNEEKTVYKDSLEWTTFCSGGSLYIDLHLC